MKGESWEVWYLYFKYLLSIETDDQLRVGEQSTENRRRLFTAKAVVHVHCSR